MGIGLPFLDFPCMPRYDSVYRIVSKATFERALIMAVLQRIFGVVRALTLLGIVGLLLYTEYQFVHGNIANFFNPLVQLYVVGSALYLPVFRTLCVVALIAHFGKRTIQKRLARQAAEE